MDFNEYQRKAREFAVYPTKHSIVYPALGLGGEAGEVQEKIKKFLRGDVDDVVDLEKELGDVLWYLSNLASDLGISLETLAEQNIEKLSDRQQRGVIKGSGDNR